MTGAAPAWPLRTERLDLRPQSEGDLAAFHAMRANPEVTRYLYDERLTLEEAREKLAARTAARSLVAGNDWLVKGEWQSELQYAILRREWPG